MGATKIMESEHIKLNKEERAFLKRIIMHWKANKTPLEFAGFNHGGYGLNLSHEEKLASRKLLMEDLLELDIVPSTQPPPHQPNISLNMAGSFINLPIPPLDKTPLCFDLLFTPTQKGMDTSFVEEL